MGAQGWIVLGMNIGYEGWEILSHNLAHTTAGPVSGLLVLIKDSAAIAV